MPPPTFGLDVGGTQAKLAMWVDEGEDWARWRSLVSRTIETKLRFASREEASERGAKWDEDPVPVGVGGNRASATVRPGTLHFLNFRTAWLEAAPARSPASRDVEDRSSPPHPPIDFASSLAHARTMRVSGGGAYKLERQIKWVFDVDAVERVDELDALVHGLGFLARESAYRDEVFECTNARFAGMVGSERERLETAPHDIADPFILVSVGSGVSFVDCDLAARRYERVGGSSLGGGTFHGLVTLLTGENDFDTAVEAAASGDSTKVDLLVGDIYGDGGAESLGLRASTLASSFGRMATSADARRAVSKGDLALSVLIMLGLNLSAMACLHARLCGRTRVLFTGNFLSSQAHKRNTLAVRVFAYGVDFWSQGKMTAVFLRTQGYLGAVGTLVGGERGQLSRVPVSRM